MQLSTPVGGGATVAHVYPKWPDAAIVGPETIDRRNQWWFEHVTQPEVRLLPLARDALLRYVAAAQRHPDGCCILPAVKLAQRLGVRPDSLSRSDRQLEQAGLIVRDKSRVIVTDFAQSTPADLAQGQVEDLAQSHQVTAAASLSFDFETHTEVAAEEDHFAPSTEDHFAPTTAAIDLAEPAPARNTRSLLRQLDIDADGIVRIEEAIAHGTTTAERVAAVHANLTARDMAHGHGGLARCLILDPAKPLAAVPVKAPAPPNNEQRLAAAKREREEAQKRYAAILAERDAAGEAQQRMAEWARQVMQQMGWRNHSKERGLRIAQ